MASPSANGVTRSTTMKKLLATKLLPLVAILGLMFSAARARADEVADPEVGIPRGNVFGHEAKYRAATLAEAKSTVNRWLEKAGVAEDLRKKATALWDGDMADPNGTRLLQRLG